MFSDHTTIILRFIFVACEYGIMCDTYGQEFLNLLLQEAGEQSKIGIQILQFQQDKWNYGLTVIQLFQLVSATGMSP